MAKKQRAHGHAPLTSALAASASAKTRRNHCFACGKDDPSGMHLKFFLDEPAKEAICKFKLARRYQGPPGHAHGGIIATILDEAMGKANRFSNVVALTRSMNVEYLKPVPLGTTLTVIGREQSVNGREHVNVAEIVNDQGTTLARSMGTFVAIDPGRMFANFPKTG